MAKTPARAVIEAPESAWESDVRKSPNGELSAVRDALPTLVEDPWFEEVIEDAPDSFVQSVRGWLGRYELLSPIGAGGTWLARQHGERGFTKLASIITMPARFEEAHSCAELLAEDARAAAGLRHPNMCGILELGGQGSTVYLVSEWVTGVSLDELLRPEDGVAIPLPYAFAAHVVAEACAGLHAAHELRGDEGRNLGVVHRHVSLRTLLVTAGGDVKVSELGTARAWARHEELQAAERTRAYPSSVRLASIAPEVVAGGHFDRRSDVFSLGAMLYEATTGIAPFASVEDYQSMDALLRGKYAKPSALMPGFPAELEVIIARALERDPVRRYATADAMRAALQAWIASVAVRVTTEYVSDFVRHRAGAALAAKREFVRDVTAGPQASGVRPSANATRSGTVLRAPSPEVVETSDPSIVLIEETRRRERTERPRAGTRHHLARQGGTARSSSDARSARRCPAPGE
jgi:serine/threonine-protein kinase